MINSFRGAYSFLSNFYSSIIHYNGISYPTVEHFYQAMKTSNKDTHLIMASNPSATQAKKFGREIVLRPDWEDIKIKVMDLGLRKKFSNPALAKQLIETFPQALVEGNWWGDRFWGVDGKTGVGENRLGLLLDKVRLDLICDCPLLDGPDPVF